MTQLTLIVPDLAQLNPAGAATEYLAGFNHLKAILNLSKKTKNTGDYHKNLFLSFGLAEDYHPSIAAITALYDDLKVSEPFCLRFDPIELCADLAAVYMYGNQHFSVTAEQIERIKTLVQPLLWEYAMTLHVASENRWYLTLNEKPDIISQEPHAIVGKDILNYLPKGNEPIKWQTLQTEIQMVLHGVDEIAPINCLWLWGGGEQLRSEMVLPAKTIYADDAISLGLAKHLNFQHKSLQEFAMEELSSNGKNDIIVVYNKFSALNSHEAYLKQLADFETTILSSAITALKQKKLEKIVLLADNGTEYVLTRKHFYCFCKKNNSIKEDLCKKLL